MMLIPFSTERNRSFFSSLVIDSYFRMYQANIQDLIKTNTPRRGRSAAPKDDPKVVPPSPSQGASQGEEASEAKMDTSGSDTKVLVPPTDSVTVASGPSESLDSKSVMSASASDPTGQSLSASLTNSDSLTMSDSTTNSTSVSASANSMSSMSLSALDLTSMIGTVVEAVMLKMTTSKQESVLPASAPATMGKVDKAAVHSDPAAPTESDHEEEDSDPMRGPMFPQGRPHGSAGGGKFVPKFTQKKDRYHPMRSNNGSFCMFCKQTEDHASPDCTVYPRGSMSRWLKFLEEERCLLCTKNQHGQRRCQGGPANGGLRTCAHCGGCHHVVLCPWKTNSGPGPSTQ